jgi:type IV pilus assembly protein PilW
VALTVGGMITGAALAITLSSQRVFQTDQNRTTINQNLRSGMDLLGIDVRQAGERLPHDIPAIEIVDGVNGAPDQLLLRRHLLDPVLPVCKTINAGTAADSVFIGIKRTKTSPKIPSGCSLVPDSDHDGWPDNLQAWRAYRQSSGLGWLWAYIYNPTTHVGEFFQYDADDNSTFHIHRMNPGKWQFDYDVTDNARIYILEQQTFRLQDDILQSVSMNGINGTLNLVSRITDFQARAFLSDGTILTSMNTGSEWFNLQSVEITLVGESDFANRTMQRRLVTHFFPRNVLSLSE